MLCSLISNGQVYKDKSKYAIAIKIYNDHLESYENYLNKIKFYTDFKYPKSSNYPKTGEEWSMVLKPQLESVGIKFDNEGDRYHKNIKPSGKIYINFIEDPNLDYLIVKILDYIPPNYIHSAETYSFTHPGKKPVLMEEKVIKKINEPVIEEKPTVEDFVNPDTPIISDLYLMPDGKKYTYENLIKSYPSMANKSVLLFNFKD